MAHNWFLVALCLSTYWMMAENAPPTNTITDEMSLKDCQAKLSEWKDWGNDAINKNKRLQGEYELLSANKEQVDNELKTLRSELRAARVDPLMAGAFVGFGGVAAALVCWLSWKGLKRTKSTRPWSPAGRQLLVLLVGATWISVAAFVGSADGRLSNHPINMAFTVLVYSLPALAFGGVGFWWFGRMKIGQSR